MKLYIIRPFEGGIEQESAEIEHVGWRPRTVVMDVNINTALVVIEEDRHSSVRKLADDLHIPRMLIQRILTKELEMKHVCLTRVPHFLRAEEMERRHLMALEILAGISPRFRLSLSCHHC